MNRWFKQAVIAAVATIAAFQASSRLAIAQQAAPTKTALAEQVFKNIQVLKGIPVDDFMQTMGLMTAALQSDCAGCHVGAGTTNVDWAADTAMKVKARKMVTMVTNINKTNFGGAQMVTCYTCHRNRDVPLTTPTMAVIYGTPNIEPDDVLMRIPGMDDPEEILDKYIQAVGGSTRLATLKSFDGRGKSVTFGGFGGEGEAEIIAQAPDKRSTIILFKAETERGDQIRTYDGIAGWVRTPLNVLGEFELAGGDLDGSRFDAQLSFPGQIKQILTNLKSGPPTTIADLPAPSSQADLQQGTVAEQTHLVDQVQGIGPRGLLVTLYFDKQTGLLLREVRYSRSPIGRVPTQVDYADYREVEGIKFPFRITFAWLDGRDSIELDEIKLNAPIDQSKFARPAPGSRK